MISEIFHFNNTVLNLEARPLNPLTYKPGEFDFTLKAFREEIEEMEEGYAKQDVVKMVDSALDLIYFAVGSLRRMGLTETQAIASFMAVHNANMTKKKGTVAKRGDFSDDAIKPEGFIPPDEAIAAILLQGQV